MDIGRILEDVLIPDPVIDEEFDSGAHSIRTLSEVSPHPLLSDLLKTVHEHDNARTSP